MRMSKGGYLIVLSVLLGFITPLAAQPIAGGEPISGGTGGGGISIQQRVLLLWTERDASGLPQISSIPAGATPGPSVTSTRHFYTSNNEPRNWNAITNDHSDGFIFFVDQTLGAIFKGYFDTHGETIFSGNSDVVMGIAVDWLAKTLYYADATYDWIIVTDYEHEWSHILIDTGLDKPHGLAVFPQKGFLFWTDWGRSPKIERSTLDGESRTVLVNTGLYQPNGLTVDYDAERLYWVENHDTLGSSLVTCDLNGGDRRTLSTTSAVNGFYYDLALFEDTIFISDYKNKKIRFINKNDGSEVNTMSFTTEPYGLTVYGPNQLPTGDTPSPCASNPCEHLCISTATGYQCVCSQDYLLQSDGRTCIRDEAFIHGRVYYVSPTSICSHYGNYIEVEGSENNETCVISKRDLAVAMVTDPHGRLLFYSDFQKRAVYWVRLFGGEPIQRVVSGVGSVEGLAVDWLNQNLYWTDYIQDHIAVSRYDGSYRQILISNDVLSPRSIVIHAGQRLMFWTELDADNDMGQIERAGLNGENRVVIASNVGSANGLAIDFEHNRLYYADRDTSAIAWVNFDGNGRTVVYTRPGAEFFDLAINRDYLLWTEWGAMSGIHAINRETGEFVKYVPSDTDLYDIDLYDPVTQPDGNAVCGQNNGRCDHLCLPRYSSSYTCACATGYTLQNDGMTCGTSVKSDNFMLLTDSGLRTIFQIDLGDPNLPFSALPLDDLDNPFGLTYDPIESTVYWGDGTQQTINRANLDGSGRDELLGPYNGIQTPEGLAIEPNSRLLYWSDVGRKTISVSKLDGRYKKTLIDTDLDNPRGILVDHINRRLFWSDWGLQKIERSSLDGSNRQVIVAGAGVGGPNGLAVDYTSNKLFYCDPLIRSVVSVGFDGTDRKTFFQLPSGFLPIGIAIYNQDQIFISDWSASRLIRARQSDPTPEFVGDSVFGRMNNLHVYSAAHTDTGTNACSNNNGGCEELCFATTNGKTCSCQDEAPLLANNLDCGAPITGFFICSATFTNGRVGSECDRKPESSCAVQCNAGYESTTDFVTCGNSGVSWDVPNENTICTAINPCSTSPCVNGNCNNLLTHYTCTCHPGWEGLTCNIDVNECASLPCMNGGSCEDRVNGYTCQCLDGFTGTSCQIGSDPCSSSPCLNSGTCLVTASSYACQCSPGYAGTRCEQDIDECSSNPCLNNGLCTDHVNRYTCTCVDGYYGTRCENELNACDSRPCLNQGTCTSVTNGFTCSCKAGFVGTNCESNVDECLSSPCQNLGTCVDLVNGYFCFCVPGFSGLRCGINTDECSSNPCRNGGVCSDFLNAYSCLCLGGYRGVNCEMDNDECISQPCLNGGSCTDLVNRFSCQCLDGYSGATCGINFDECFSSPCMKSGTCFDLLNGYLCACQLGFSGLRCEINDPDCEPDPCQNGGSCRDLANTFECACSQGWTGNLCELSTNVCSSGPCANGGSCTGDSTAFTCNCISGFTGQRCEVNINECLSSPCLSSGTCYDIANGYLCACQSGFSGLRCEIDSDECSSSPCEINGVCVDLVNSYRCDCKPGYTGIHCQIDINDCSGAPCANGGTCTDLVNAYLCSCITGYTGTNCQTRVTCPGLTSPANGKITPSTCQTSGFNGDSCVFICNEGDYIITGPPVQTCTVSGIWSQQGLATNCVFRDTTPPVFTTTCPVQIQATVDTACSKHTVVTYDLPMASDNSGQVTITPAASSPEVLEIGRYERTYRAEDAAGNRAECQVVINVQGIDCGSPPQADASGYIAAMSCLHMFGSVATYQCYPGQVMNGNSQLQCGSNGVWVGSPPTCQEINCDALTVPTNGFIAPSTCYSGTVSTETTCSIWCDAGYSLNGVDATTSCALDGSWTSDLSNALCQDVRAPVFSNCPSSFTIGLAPSASKVVVTWAVPTATSKGQEVPAVHSGGLTPPATLGAGSHFMEYVARDGSLVSYCRFTITVQDTEPPEIQSCPSEALINETSSFPYVLEWTEPTFTDNVEVTEVLQDGAPGNTIFTWGVVTVRYSAFDAAGNVAECVVNINIIQSRSTCPTLVDPVNGRLECEESKCTALCDDGFVFTNRNRPRGAYVCQPSGMWSHATAEDPVPELPACVQTTLLNPVTWMRQDTLLLGGAECNADTQAQIRMVVTTVIDNSSWMAACTSTSDNDCSIGSINVECFTEGGSRKRRQTGTDFEVKYALIAKRQDSTDTTALDQIMAISATDVVAAQSLTINVNGQSLNLDVTGAETGDVISLCEPGYEAAGTACVSCPVGTSFDLATSGCSPCAIGSYQDEEGKLLCKECPVRSSTSGTGSYDVTQCEESCSVGQLSYTGLTPCQNCPRGTFQSESGQRGCQPCAEGDSTITSGATTFEQCLAIGSFTPIFTTSASTTGATTESTKPASITLMITIVASVVAFVVLILIIVGVACCLVRRCRNSNKEDGFALDDMGADVYDNVGGYNGNQDNRQQAGYFGGANNHNYEGTIVGMVREGPY